MHPKHRNDSRETGRLSVNPAISESFQKGISWACSELKALREFPNVTVARDSLLLDPTDRAVQTDHRLMPALRRAGVSAHRSALVGDVFRDPHPLGLGLCSSCTIAVQYESSDTSAPGKLRSPEDQQDMKGLRQSLFSHAKESLGVRHIDAIAYTDDWRTKPVPQLVLPLEGAVRIEGTKIAVIGR